MTDITQLRDNLETGDPKAAEDLLPLVYSESRRMAAAKMSRDAANHTLQPTALVHEAWIRLTNEKRGAIPEIPLFSY